MNISPLPQTSIPQTAVQSQALNVSQQSQELSKDLVKVNVESMIQLSKMEYIGTLVDMVV